MRNIFRLKKTASSVKLAVGEAEDEETRRFWDLINSGKPAKRNDSFPSRGREDESDDYDHMDDDHGGGQGLIDQSMSGKMGRHGKPRFDMSNQGIFQFVITYSPPENIKNRLRVAIDSSGSASVESIDMMGNDFDTVAISIATYDGEKQTAYDLIEHAMRDVLNKTVENVEDNDEGSKGAD
jgi:hypothetical protein